MGKTLQRRRRDSVHRSQSGTREGARPLVAVQKPIRVLKMPIRQGEIATPEVSKSRPVENVVKQTSPSCTKQHGVSAATTLESTARVPSNPASNNGAKRSLADQLRHYLRQYELLKKQALCAELTHTDFPNQSKFEQAQKKLAFRIRQLRKQLASKPAEFEQKKTLPVTKPQRVISSGKQLCKVRLSLSRSTARVLKAFADAGKSPTALVERSLWANSNVQDAALLLNVKPPQK